MGHGSQQAGPPSDALRVGIGGFTLLGLLIARLTLELNPHLQGQLRDSLLLLLYFFLGYGLVGLALGTAGTLLLGFSRRVPALARMLPILHPAACSVLLLGPLLYYLLLPDAGLAGGWLANLIFSGSRAGQLAAAAAVGLALIGIGRILGLPLHALCSRTGLGARTLLTAAWLIGALAAGVSALTMRAEPAAAASARGAGAPLPADPMPPRLVLLCIDGTDLDDVILPMVADGELPTFGALMREGTWGELSSFEPTLSPIIWTTIITGKPPEQHDIRHFIYYRLPGIRQSVVTFPRQTGLNFQIIPFLDRLSLLPPLMVPYTSNMRRAKALWNIVGETYSAGAYRWLVTWPAEKINGFVIAGDAHLIERLGPAGDQAPEETRKLAVHPQDVYDGIPPGPEAAITPADLEPYVGAGYPIDPEDRQMRKIAAGLRDDTGYYLPRLIAKYDTRFTAASFYNVDNMSHYFSRYRNRGGIFAGAVAERYRFTDARLGEFIRAMGDSVNIVIISDHGFDFAHNHHIYAPPGVFFARGPAFSAGRRVAGLSVYDVAPMALHLLGIPLPEDMPGTATGNYRRALSKELLSASPIGRVATYETAAEHDVSPVESPDDEKLKETLRSLGYIN